VTPSGTADRGASAPSKHTPRRQLEGLVGRPEKTAANHDPLSSIGSKCAVAFRERAAERAERSAHASSSRRIDAVRLVNRWVSRRSGDVRVSLVRTNVRVAAACAVPAALRGWRHVQVAGRVTVCRTRALKRFTRRGSSCGIWVRMQRALFALHGLSVRPTFLSLSRSRPSRAEQTARRTHEARGAEAPGQRTAASRLLRRVSPHDFNRTIAATIQLHD